MATDCMVINKVVAIFKYIAVEVVYIATYDQNVHTISTFYLKH